MKISSVLVEYEDTNEMKTYANSGTFFANKYVIVTANILTPILKLSLPSFTKLPKGLVPVDTLLNFNPKLTVIFEKLSNGIIYENAFPVAAFWCKNVCNSLEKCFPDWAIDVQENDQDVKYLLPLFFILEIAIEGTTMNELEVALRDLLKNCGRDIYPGKNVCIESTPFGNRHFLNSYSQGIVSNVIGENNCLILTDCPSVPGSEGSPIFSFNKRKLLGIAVSSLSWWKGEWIGLTLGVNIVPLLQNLLLFRRDEIIYHQFSNEVLYEKICKSVAQVVSYSNWGTCLLLNKEDGIFLTNAHVVENFKTCKIYWKHLRFEAFVLFKTDENCGYDLAVLQTVSKNLAKSTMSPIVISRDFPKIGEEIFAVGYPLFPKYLQIKPTLTRGHISQITRYMLKTTCWVHAGSSGGAILNHNGDTIGLIVCNAKLKENGSIYTKLSMAIPIAKIYETIQTFLENKDISIFNDLCKFNRSNREWNLENSKL